MAFTAESPLAQREPGALKVVPVTGAAFSGFTMDPFLCAFLFPTPHIDTVEHTWYVVQKVSRQYRERDKDVKTIRATLLAPVAQR